MTMKFTQLRTYWDAGEAQTVIAFLDELREVLLTVYADEISESNNKNISELKHHSHHDELSDQDII